MITLSPRANTASTKEPLGEEANSADYAYYPTGMRSSKYVFATNKRQNYYGVNNQVCEVYEFDGILGTEPSGPTQEFIYEGLDEPIAMFTNADGNGFTGAKGGRKVYFYYSNPTSY